MPLQYIFINNELNRSNNVQIRLYLLYKHITYSMLLRIIKELPTHILYICRISNPNVVYLYRYTHSTSDMTSLLTKRVTHTTPRPIGILTTQTVFLGIGCIHITQIFHRTKQ